MGYLALAVPLNRIFLPVHRTAGEKKHPYFTSIMRFINVRLPACPSSPMFGTDSR
jgi:hypothetical protein